MKVTRVEAGFSIEDLTTDEISRIHFGLAHVGNDKDASDDMRRSFRDMANHLVQEGIKIAMACKHITEQDSKELAEIALNAMKVINPEMRDGTEGDLNQF